MTSHPHISESERFYRGLNRVLRGVWGAFLIAVALLGFGVIASAGQEHNGPAMASGLAIVGGVALVFLVRGFRR